MIIDQSDTGAVRFYTWEQVDCDLERELRRAMRFARASRIPFLRALVRWNTARRARRALTRQK